MKQFSERNFQWLMAGMAVVMMLIGMAGIILTFVNQKKLDRNYAAQLEVRDTVKKNGEHK